MADIGVANKFLLDNEAPYSISKAAINMAVAKYNATYADEGILFIALSPGVVDSGGPQGQYKAKNVSKWVTDVVQRRRMWTRS